MTGNSSEAFDRYSTGDQNPHNTEDPSEQNGMKEKADANKLPENVLQFAEILYKCTLCKSLPVILTSEKNFRLHMRSQHFCTDKGPSCGLCPLTFTTAEDMGLHSSTTHPLAAAKNDTENVAKLCAVVKTTPNSRKLLNPCSAGMRGIGTVSRVDTIVNDMKTGGNYPSQTGQPGVKFDETKRNHVHDIGIEHRVIRHPPCETKVNLNNESKNQRKPCESLSRLQELTEEIMASSLRTLQKNSAECDNKNRQEKPRLPLPGHTKEFGKYTKLVREGGNIVYFCQVCNWKCPSNTNFRLHCAGLAHKAKFNMLTKPRDEMKAEAVSEHADCRKSDCHDSYTYSDVEHQRTEFQLINVKTSGILGNRPNFSSEVCEKRNGRTSGHTDSRHVFVDAQGSGNKVINEDRAESKSLESKSVTGNGENGAINYEKTISNSSSCVDENRSGTTGTEDGLSDINTNRRRRRKRPIPRMVRNQPEDVYCDWSDCSTSTGSDVGESSPDEITNKARRTTQSEDNSESKTKVIKSKSEESFVFQTTNVSILNSVRSSVATSIKQFSHQWEDRRHLFYSSEKHSDWIKHERQKQETNVDDSKETSVQHSDDECNDIDHRECNQHENDRNDADQECDSGDNNETMALKTNGGESWKILRIKEILPDLLCGSSRGNISRDALLQKVSVMLQTAEAINWGPACNRAVREEFPNSIAQRKGKFKKTYFFGVKFKERLFHTEEFCDGETISFQPLRDMSLDTDKILQYLPDLVFWTGDLDYGVSRDELLRLLVDRIDDSNVLVWGIECNRAVRKLYPDVHTKRKGKYKTTVFYGLSYLPHVAQGHRITNCLKALSANLPESMSTGSVFTYKADDSVVGISMKMVPSCVNGNKEDTQSTTANCIEVSPSSPTSSKEAIAEEAI